MLRANCVLGAESENAAPAGPRNGAPAYLRANPSDAETPDQQVSGYRNGRTMASPLDRHIAVTTFADTRAMEAVRHVVTLREQAPRIAKRRSARKIGLPLLKLATFGDQPTDKGTLRHDGNVTAIDGVEGDHDSGTLKPEEAADRLQQAGIAAIIHTSPSHTPEHPCWHVLCPTSRSMLPEDRERLCARLQGVLGGALAPESFTLSQTFYYGAADRVEDKETSEWRDGFPVETIIVEGAGIDTLDSLDAGALDKRGKPYGGGKTGQSPEKPGECDSADDLMYVPPELLRALAEPDGDDWADFQPLPQVRKIRRALDAIPTEARDERESCWRPVGMALHHEFAGSEAGFALWDEWSKASPKYDARDQRRVWESFGRHGGKATSIATLYAMAKDHGWNGKAALPRASAGLRFRRMSELGQSPARDTLVRSFLSRGNVACIFGPPGVGKSVLAPYLAHCVATGEPAFGLQTKAGLVFYVAPEDSTGMEDRLRALRRRVGDTDNLLLVDGVSDLLDEDSEDRARLSAEIESQRPALVIIDTLAIGFVGLDENDARDMNRVVAACRDMARHGAAVVLIHHGTKAEGTTPRGHSVLNGALDVTLELRKDESDGIIRGRLGKNRNGPQDLDIAFRVTSEALGRDDWGLPLTAAIIDVLPAGAAPRRARLPAGEIAALSILRELEKRGDVSEADWRTACAESRSVSGAETLDARQRHIRRVVAQLARKGLIAIAAGMARTLNPDATDMDWPEDDE